MVEQVLNVYRDVQRVSPCGATAAGAADCDATARGTTAAGTAAGTARRPSANRRSTPATTATLATATCRAPRRLTTEGKRAADSKVNRYGAWTLSVVARNESIARIRVIEVRTSIRIGSAKGIELRERGPFVKGTVQIEILARRDVERRPRVSNYEWIKHQSPPR